MKPTQTNDVLMHLKEHGTITTNEAIDLYRATRLSDIILRLRKHHIIETIIEEGKTRHNRPSRYAVYCYWGEREKNNAESTNC